MCNFFCWLPGSQTPSLLPQLGLTNVIPQPIGLAPGLFLPIPGAGDVNTNLPVVPPKPSCHTMGCNSTWIHKNCSQRRCKAHCLETGAGCADLAHKGLKSSALSYVMAALPTTYPTSVLLNTSPTSSLNHMLRQTEVQMAPPLPASSSKSLTNTLMEPAFSSHMTDIYTTQVALEERMRETGWQMEATQLESKWKVQQTIFVYAWMEVSFESL